MATTTMTLTDLTTQLAAVHGDALCAVVLYGSAASDEHVAGHSDHNVLVIVDHLSIGTLRQLGQTTRAWQEAGNPSPLTFTREEWHRSADIFPMEYADILERHRVLSGTLPIDGVQVKGADLRLQTEHEAMGKLLRLRRGVMSAGTDTSRQTELLRASLSSLLVVFRAVLRLRGLVPPRDAQQVVRAVAEQCGFDAAPFERVVALVRGTAIPERETEAVLAGYVTGMESLVAYLDRFVPPTTATDSHLS